MSNSNQTKFKSVLNKILNRAPMPTALKDRSDYKSTWNHLAANQQEAANYVAGHGTVEEELNHTGQHTVEILDRFIGIKPDDIILEIGCGVGRVGKLLSRRCSKWIGVDISERMLHFASQRLKGLDNIELVELSTAGLKEIPDSSVNVVYCTVVFMHLYEWDRYKYVEESFRVLRPGGRCFFDNVDITSDHGWQVFTEGYKYTPGNRPAQLSMVSTGDELETYARKAGYCNIRIHRWDSAWVGVTGVKPEPIES